MVTSIGSPDEGLLSPMGSAADPPLLSRFTRGISPHWEDAPLPRWTPLYLLLLIAGTLSPFWIHYQPAGLRDFSMSPAPVDLALNLLLFAPLGFAFRSWRVVRLAGLALLLSSCIEVAQLWLPRFSSPADIAANVAGALLGRFVPALP